jgi:uncharacterized protein (DUF58 family)
MFAKIRSNPFWQQWVRVADSTGTNAILSPRKIYIIPTLWGFLYGLMLLGLLAGAINYSVSLGFFVTFLLTSLGNLGMLHTWRNLVYLEVRLQHAKPVFAGETAQVLAEVSDTKNRVRYAICAHFPNNTQDHQDIPANATQSFQLPIVTHQRGYFVCPRLTLYTEFPLSLFYAWAYVAQPLQILVYPKPVHHALDPRASADVDAQGNAFYSKGDDEFNGHKTYQQGDAVSRVDWKASSRGIGLFTKQYSGKGQSTVWLDWESTSGLEKEARISQLTYWVIEAYQSQQTFGLRLPNGTLKPSNTEAHYHQALTALAVL